MNFLCDMIYFVTVTLFGTAISFCFAGVTSTKRNLLSLLVFCALQGTLHVSISYVFGMATAKQLYPLITHLPLLIYLIIVHKRTLLHSAVSVLSAYLCCQIPWWFSHFFNIFVTGKIAYTVFYELSAIITFVIIYRYIAQPTVHFMNISKKSALLIGSVPFFYYCFDYVTTVYTNWLYAGNTAAVQFMPSVIACFYFIFVIIYYKELTLKEAAKLQAEALNLQLKSAASALNNMRKLQENTITYRHDMRHHLTYIKSMVSAENFNGIQSYINEITSDIDAVTPKIFCRNEVINLILSTYDQKAARENITLNIQADVPETISISDTDLCAILSNALENAINATSKATEKKIDIKLKIRISSLLIQISNPFSGKISFENGIPLSTEEGHGLGTKSIAALTDSYKGHYTFTAEGRIFMVRIILPL